MRGLVAPVMIMLLALLHAPNQAQALFFDFLPADWVQLGSSEPVTLVLTGLALLSLGRLTVNGARGAAARGAAERRPRPARARAATESTVGADAASTSTRRAA